MDNLSKIKEFIQKQGPIIPIQAAKEIGTNILMASAMLSELSSKGDVVVSSIKIGGSPLYYLPGQQVRLQSFISNLNEPQKKAYDRLQSQEVIQDTKTDPVTRQALRQIKDFAKPMEVKTETSKEIFWKWYLVENDKASELIRQKLGVKTIKKTPTKPKPIPKPKIKPKPIQPKIIKKEIQKPLTKLPKPKPIIQDNFLDTLMAYFQKNKIEISEKSIIRKNNEIDFIVNIPSALGSISYFAKAKNKKLLNESDLSSTYGKAQLKKLPALLITTGELSKKGKLSAEKDFHEIKIIKI